MFFTLLQTCIKVDYEKKQLKFVFQRGMMVSREALQSNIIWLSLLVLLGLLCQRLMIMSDNISAASRKTLGSFGLQSDN